MVRRYISDKRIIEALRQTGGRMYLAAELLKCNHRLLFRRAARSKVISQTVEFYQGRFRDVLESVIMRGALENESWAVRTGMTLPVPTVDVNSEPRALTGAQNAELMRKIFADPRYRRVLRGEAPLEEKPEPQENNLSGSEK